MPDLDVHSGSRLRRVVAPQRCKKGGLLDVCLSHGSPAALALGGSLDECSPASLTPGSSLDECSPRSSLAACAPGGLLDVCLPRGPLAALALGSSLGKCSLCSLLAALALGSPLDVCLLHGSLAMLRVAARSISFAATSLWQRVQCVLAVHFACGARAHSRLTSRSTHACRASSLSASALATLPCRGNRSPSSAHSVDFGRASSFTSRRRNRARHTAPAVVVLPATRLPLQPSPVSQRQLSLAVRRIPCRAARAIAAELGPLRQQRLRSES